MLIFHQFTWQQFLYAAAVLIVIYYVTVGLLFFPQELQHYLSGGSKPEKPEKDREEEPEAEREGGLMGNAKPVEGLSTADMGDFGFTRLGIVPDILEELKTIFHNLEMEDGSKEDFIDLFGRVSAKYPQTKGSPDQDALNDYIRENLPFEITDEELEELWP